MNLAHRHVAYCTFKWQPLLIGGRGSVGGAHLAVEGLVSHSELDEGVGVAAHLLTRL